MGAPVQQASQGRVLLWVVRKRPIQACNASSPTNYWLHVRLWGIEPCR
jgi:hypothetical protein